LAGSESASAPIALFSESMTACIAEPTCATTPAISCPGTSGQWVSPVEVEAALIAHPAVLECAVVGDKDADELVKPRAYVVLNQGYLPSLELAEELKAFIKRSLLPFKYPRWIDFVAELPKTATGKIQRFKLREH